MKIKLLWVVAALFLFIFFLLAKLPAQQVVGRLDLGPNVAMQQVSGSFWQGEMGRLVVDGLPIDNVRWNISPFGFLAGKLSADIDAGNMRDTDAITVDGKVSIVLTGAHAIQSDELMVFVPTARVLAQVALPIPVQAGGRFRLRFEELDFGPTCSAMQGWGDWLNASVGGTNGPISLGSFTAEMTCAGDDVKLQVAEPNTLGLSFVSTVSPDFKRFSVSGKFKPSPDLPDDVHRASRFFGTPGADGYTAFEL